MIALLAFVSLSGTPAPLRPIFGNIEDTVPTLNLSAVRPIYCRSKEGSWWGTGSIINKRTLLTAAHVSEGGKCEDVMTGAPLLQYYIDKEHDLALMTGTLPNIPPVKISCAGYEKGRSYAAYGYSPMFAVQPLLRMNKVTFDGTHPDVEIGKEIVVGMARLKGFWVAGMSGGIVTTEDGYQVGMVNAGYSDAFRIPLGTNYSFEYKNTILCRR